jgi:hypothetical protein
MPWPHKQYGSIPDPIHKSHLNELTGEYGCPRRFRYQRDAEHAAMRGDPDPTGRVAPTGATRVNAALACGTAVHETIARALNNAAAREDLLSPRAADHSLLVGGVELGDRVRRTFEHELRIAADGRELDFGKESPDDMVRGRIAMIVGVLRALHRYVRRVIAVEPGFICELEGVWYSGHIDLVYEPVDGAPGDVAICDWKTGASKPHAIELAHGWEAGVYSLACLQGGFLPREAVTLTKHDGTWCGRVDFGDAPPVVEHRPTRWQAERDALESALKYMAAPDAPAHPTAFRVGRYPKRVYHVHLHDYVPYQKAGTKQAKRAEDLDWYGIQPGDSTTVKYVAGDLRGPAWLPVELHEHDVRRLAHRTRNVVGTVRMGRFVDLVREHCQRCPFARDCLTDGYAARGDELAALESTLRQAGL